MLRWCCFIKYLNSTNRASLYSKPFPTHSSPFTPSTYQNRGGVPLSALWRPPQNNQHVYTHVSAHNSTSSSSHHTSCVHRVWLSVWLNGWIAGASFHNIYTWLLWQIFPPTRLSPTTWPTDKSGMKNVCAPLFDTGAWANIIAHTHTHLFWRQTVNLQRGRATSTLPRTHGVIHSSIMYINIIIVCVAPRSAATNDACMCELIYEQIIFTCLWLVVRCVGGG